MRASDVPVGVNLHSIEPFLGSTYGSPLDPLATRDSQKALAVVRVGSD